MDFVLPIEVLHYFVSVFLFFIYQLLILICFLAFPYVWRTLPGVRSSLYLIDFGKLYRSSDPSYIFQNLRGECHDETASVNPAISPETVIDSRFVYPLTLHYDGGMGGGPHILHAESSQIRVEEGSSLLTQDRVRVERGV